MKQIILLLSVRLLSYTGSYIGFLAMSVFMLSLNFSPTFLAYIFFIRVSSGILSSPLIGYISDIWSRKLMMLITDFIMAIAVIILIIIPKEYLYIYVPVFMFIAGGLANVFDLALNAALPVMIDSTEPKKLLKINSWMLGGKHFAIVISGLFIALSYKIFKSYYAIFIIDAFSYLLSGFVIFFLKVKTNETLKRPKSLTKVSNKIFASKDLEVKKKNSLKSFLIKHIRQLIKDYKDILPLLKTYTIVAGLILLFVKTIASSTLNIAWPVISKFFDPSTPMSFYGFITMSWGLGNVLGIYSTNNKHIYKHESSSIEKFYLTAQLIMGIGLGLTVLAPNKSLAIVFAIFGGMGDGVAKNLLVLYGQKFEDSVRGKLFAIANIINRSGFAIGFLLVSTFLHFFTIQEITVSLHILPIFLVLIFVFLKTKRALVKNNKHPIHS